MGRPTSIEYRFVPEEFRILREMRDADGNVVDSRNASAEETLEIDPTIMDEIITFGEQQFPQLFTGIREMSTDDMQKILTQLDRMRESLVAYIGYRDEQVEPASEQGAVEGTVTIDGEPAKEVDVMVADESGIGKQAVTDENGKYVINLSEGSYQATVSPDNHDSQTQSVDVAARWTSIVDFDFTTQETS